MAGNGRLLTGLLYYYQATGDEVWSPGGVAGKRPPIRINLRPFCAPLLPPP
jgi:hypothetical protein